MKNILKKYSIIFDLDETLIHSVDINQWSKIHYSIKNKLEQENLLFEIDSETIGIKRPHLDTFLTFISSNFGHVGVWSAGIKPYIENIVVNIFDKTPDFAWSRFDCDYKIIYRYNENTFVKPLHQVWDGFIDGFTEENTFMIEDRIDTVLYNPHNLVKLTPYKPLKNKSLITEDEELLKLITFFKDIKTFTPVPLLKKPMFSIKK